MKAIRFTSMAILSLLLGIAAPAYSQEQKGETQGHPEQQQTKHAQTKPDQRHAQKQQQDHDKQQQQRVQEQQQGQNKQQQQRAQKQRQDQDKQQRQAQKQHQDQNEQQQQHAQKEQQDQNRQQQAQERQPSEEKQRQHQAQKQQQDQSRQQHAQDRGNPQPLRDQEQRRMQQSAWQQHRARSWHSDHRNWQQRGGYNGYRIPDDRFRGSFGPEHKFRIYGLPFLVVGGYPRFQYNGYWFSLVDPWPEDWANNWYDTDDVYVTYSDNGYYLFNRRHPGVGIAISISM